MRILALIILCLYFTACGGGSDSASSSAVVSGPQPPLNTGLTCSGSFIDSWDNLANGDTLTLFDNCSGSSTLCGYVFTYSQPVGSTSTLTIISNNGTPGCLSVGNYSCQLYQWDRMPDPHTVDHFLDVTCSGYATENYMEAP